MKAAGVLAVGAWLAAAPAFADDDPLIGYKRLSEWRRQLTDADHKFREKGERQLAQLGPRAAPLVPELIADLRRPNAEGSAAECPAGRALVAVGTAAVPALVREVSARGDRWYLADDILNKMGLAAAPAYAEMLSAEDVAIRREAALRLGRFGPEAEGTAPQLAAALGDPDATVRRRAAFALAYIQGAAGRAAAPLLIEASRDSDAEGRRAAIRALAEIGPKAADVVPALAARLADGVASVEAEAFAALLQTGPDAAAPLRDVLAGDRRAMRVRAAWVLLFRELRAASIDPAAFFPDWPFPPRIDRRGPATQEDKAQAGRDRPILFLDPVMEARPSAKGWFWVDPTPTVLPFTPAVPKVVRQAGVEWRLREYRLRELVPQPVPTGREDAWRSLREMPFTVLLLRIPGMQYMAAGPQRLVFLVFPMPAVLPFVPAAQVVIPIPPAVWRYPPELALAERGRRAAEIAGGVIDRLEKGGPGTGARVVGALAEALADRGAVFGYPAGEEPRAISFRPLAGWFLDRLKPGRIPGLSPSAREVVGPLVEAALDERPEIARLAEGLLRRFAPEALDDMPALKAEAAARRAAARRERREEEQRRTEVVRREVEQERQAAEFRAAAERNAAAKAAEAADMRRWTDMLFSPDPAVRVRAVVALSRSGNPGARTLLKHAASEDTDEFVRQAAAKALEKKP